MGAQYIEAVIVVCGILIILLPLFLLVLVFMLPLCPKSKCTAFWKRFPYVVLQIIGIPAFFGVLTMAMLTYQLKGYFVEHYDEYKCKPWFMPFVSWIKPDASTTGNFSDCLSPNFERRVCVDDRPIYRVGRRAGHRDESGTPEFRTRAEQAHTPR